MQLGQLKRREFITLVGGAAATWPFATRAQQTGRVHRIGELAFAEGNQEGQARAAAFRNALEQLGWIEGRNIQLDIRWVAANDTASLQRFAKELVALQPDLILSYSTPITAALLQQTRSIPIVFATFLIQLAVGLWRILPDQAATRPASLIWSHPCPGSGLSSSRRLRHVFRGWRCYSTRRQPLMQKAG
jgi:putative ABC transport system substrate-binding protein